MKINIYNAEGYVDPTAHDAIENVMKEQNRNAEQRNRLYMPRVFICSPFAGDVERNTVNAGRYCAFAVECGYIPFAPHLFFPQFLEDSDPEQRKLGLFMGQVFLDGSKELWVFGDRISPGMEREIARAKKRGITIRYFKGVPTKSNCFVGKGEATKLASFRDFAEVAEAEFAPTSKEVVNRGIFERTD